MIRIKLNVVEDFNPAFHGLDAHVYECITILVGGIRISHDIKWDVFSHFMSAELPEECLTDERKLRQVL